MSNIEQNLAKILNSRYGKDVRQAIHDSIETCYTETKFVPRGAYSSTTTYSFPDMVTYGGGSYLYIYPTPAAGVPVTNTSHWQQIAEKGATGDVTPAAEAARDAAAESAALLGQYLSRENHYYVGAGMQYETITAAVAQWTTDGKPDSIIHIMKGVYNEKVNLGGMSSNLSFIGEDKAHVVWKQTTGYYPDCPLSISGNVVIKNITFIADHTSTPGYTYVPYTTGNTGAAYALHLDAPNAPGVVRVENCDLYSYQNAAIGCGTCVDRSLQIINCRLFSLGNIAGTLANGALLYHGDAADGVTGQELVLKHNYFYHAYSSLVAYLQNTGDTKVDIEMVGNVLDSGVYTTNDALVTLSFKEFFTIAKNSCGNNVERMNAPESSWQKAKLTDDFGNAVLYTDDFNNAKTGLFKGNTLLGTANTPVAGHAILGLMLPYSSAYYKVQYAWDVEDAFKLYRRTWSTSSWTAWVAQDGITTAVQTALDLKATKLLANTGITASFNLTTGYKDLLLVINSPDAVTITIPLNSSAAWAIGSRVKIYRRGTGAVTISGAEGVTIESVGSLKSISAQWAMAELYKLGTDTWVLTGSLA